MKLEAQKLRWRRGIETFDVSRPVPVGIAAMAARI